MLDLYFSKKIFLQNSVLSDVDYISNVFFYFGSYWGGGLGELRLGHFPEIFNFITNFLNLIMHIRGPLIFRLI